MQIFFYKIKIYDMFENLSQKISYLSRFTMHIQILMLDFVHFYRAEICGETQRNSLRNDTLYFPPRTRSYRRLWGQSIHTILLSSLLRSRKKICIFMSRDRRESIYHYEISLRLMNRQFTKQLTSIACISDVCYIKKLTLQSINCIAKLRKLTKYIYYILNY